MTRRKPLKRSYPWTPEQLEILDRMGNAEVVSWDEIGVACGHPPRSAQSTFYRRRVRLRAEGKAPPRQDNRRPWTQEEINEMLRLREQGMTFAEIDKKIGRNIGASNSKYYTVCAPITPHGQPEAGTRVFVTPAALADRDARYQARLLQSPIAQLMGEPPPGHSALDKMRRGEAR